MCGEQMRHLPWLSQVNAIFVSLKCASCVSLGANMADYKTFMESRGYEELVYMNNNVVSQMVI